MHANTSSLSVILVFLLACSSASQFCDPSNSTCWPTHDEILLLSSQLHGKLLQRGIDDEYWLYEQPKNRILSVFPEFVLLPGPAFDFTYPDISKCLSFVKKHNLELTILSSGHTYTGRSYGMYNYSFQINFMLHKRIVFDELYNSVTVETGVIFDDLYPSVDSLGKNGLVNETRLVIGGDCKTVAIGGYILGGGHSPISSWLGLGIDSVLSFGVIIANGSYLTVDRPRDSDDNDGSDADDLFWALTGGGGGTFGIVLNVTLKLHKYEPDYGFTKISLEYPFYYKGELIADDVLFHYFNNVLPTLSNHVSGLMYVFASGDLSGQDVDVDTIASKSSNSGGRIEQLLHMNGNYDGPIALTRISFALVYVGNVSAAYNELNNLTNYKPEWQIKKKNGSVLEAYEYFNTFWEYEETNPGGEYLNAYAFDGLYTLDKLSNKTYIDTVIDMANGFNHEMKMNSAAALAMSHIVVGGNVSNVNVNDTSITPLFREAKLYVEFMTEWEMDDYNDKVFNFMDNYAAKFRSYSGGAYFNEDNANNPNWAKEYWGERNYNKLLKIKEKYDPQPYLFNCHYCIGYTD